MANIGLPGLLLIFSALGEPSGLIGMGLYTAVMPAPIPMQGTLYAIAETVQAMEVN